jgi:hypothetical protein
MQSQRQSVLSTAATVVAVAGAAGSVALVLRAGRHNSSWVLPALFTAWVLSPYIAWAWAVSKSSSARTRTALQVAILTLVPVSLTLYGYIALGRPVPKPAFIFLMVPPAFAMSIAIVAGVVRRQA